MRLLILLFCALLEFLNLSVKGQTGTWIKQLKSKYLDTDGCIRRDQKGNIYFIVHSTADTIDIEGKYATCGSFGSVLVKYSPSGQKIWARDACALPTDMVVDKTGSCIVATKHALYKFDINGGLVWGNQNGSDIISLTQDTNGNVYGVSNKIVTNRNFSQIKKFSGTGNLLWQINSDTTQYAYFNRITCTRGGDIYVHGTASSSFKIGTHSVTASYNAFTFLTKINSAGNIVWTKQYRGWMLASQLECADDTTLLIAAFSNDTWSVLGNDTIPEDGNFLAKIDTSGQVLWTNRTNAGITFAVENNEIYTGGYFRDTGYFYKHSLIIPCTSQYVIYLMKLNSAGTLIKYQTFPPSSGWQTLDCIITDNAGSILVSGWFSDTLKFANNLICRDFQGDAYLAKIPNSISVNVSSREKWSEVEPYPNPTLSEINLTVAGNYFFKIRIFDFQGRCIKSGIYNKVGETLSIDLNDLMAGVYVLEVHTGTEKIYRKIIKQ
jgi:hypothetical protein